MKATLLVTAALAVSTIAQDTLEYGADISFPMHQEKVSTNFAWLTHNLDPEHNPTPPEFKDMPVQPLGDREAWYKNDFLQGCVDKYLPEKKHKRCLNNERERIEMNVRQPQSMVNYTKYGYTKIRAPEHVFKLIKEFWDINRDKAKPENWPAGNTYTNHWAAPSTMVNVEDKSFKGGGFVLKQNIWNAARDTISEWTGQQLAECSLYGIRIYPTGAVLAPHVDRLPLVASAIINVDQDVDEPWPLEVIGHDGKAHNVTMVPGDLVLYESHSVIHGRPFPLKGRFMANVFIHFEPIGPVGGDLIYGTTEIPPYVIPGSPEEPNWRMRNPNGHVIMKTQSYTLGTTEAHRAAGEGNLQELTESITHHEEYVNARDANGWTPLHEAVRQSSVEVVKFLLDHGSNPNSRTGDSENGGSVLYWAKLSHDDDHEIITLLKEHGAKHFAPGESEESSGDSQGEDEERTEL